MGVEEYGATWVITGSSGTCHASGILASGMAFFITRAYPNRANCTKTRGTDCQFAGSGSVMCQSLHIVSALAL